MFATRIDDVIAELQDIKERFGNLPVASKDAWGNVCAKVIVTMEPYYYDGGIYYPIQNTEYHCKEWEKSKKHPDKCPEYVVIDSDGPEDGDLIEGIIYKDPALEKR